MSGTILKPVESIAGAGTNELDHIFCCDEDRGLCGTDLTDVPITPVDDERLCIVCRDLEFRTCERCGA